MYINLWGQLTEGMSPSSLSPLDVEKMRPYTIVKQLEKRITDDNHHETTVTILNPEEAYAEFPHHIGRLKINQMGIQIFETNGTLYQNIPADSAYQAEYNTMRNLLANNAPGIMYEFPSVPSPSTVQVIQSTGGTVVFLFCQAQGLGDFPSNLVAPLDKSEITSDFLWDKGLNGLAEPAIFDGIIRDSVYFQPIAFGFLYVQARNAFVGTGANPLPHPDVYMNFINPYLRRR